MPSLYQRFARKYRAAGAGAVALRAAEMLPDFVLDSWFKLRSGGHFILNGRKYPYFRHTYNRAFDNERTVEVPLILAAVHACQGKRILEVGNVLRNYCPALRHDVVDKYEVAPGVINEDIADFEPPGAYDLVVSISTLEHVGWDEEQKDPQKVERVVRRIREHIVAPGGSFVATIPLGYNENLDNSWKMGSLGFDRYYCLKRVSANRWREASPEEVDGAAYGYPFHSANAVLVAVSGKDVLASPAG